jgi:hypothetical protein
MQEVRAMADSAVGACAVCCQWLFGAPHEVPVAQAAPLLLLPDEVERYLAQDAHARAARNVVVLPPLPPSVVQRYTVATQNHTLALPAVAGGAAQTTTWATCVQLVAAAYAAVAPPGTALLPQLQAPLRGYAEDVLQNALLGAHCVDATWGPQQAVDTLPGGVRLLVTAQRGAAAAAARICSVGTYFGAVVTDVTTAVLRPLMPYGQQAATTMTHLRQLLNVAAAEQLWCI